MTTGHRPRTGLCRRKASTSAAQGLLRTCVHPADVCLWLIYVESNKQGCLSRCTFSVHLPGPHPDLQWRGPTELSQDLVLAWYPSGSGSSNIMVHSFPTRSRHICGSRAEGYTAAQVSRRRLRCQTASPASNKVFIEAGACPRDLWLGCGNSE